MPKICVICKKEPFSGDTTRSFHQFPKNTELRQKWMESTGISEVKKVHSVCSDHFDEDSYHQTDGYTKIRRLLSTAVPLQCQNNSVLQQITKNIVLIPKSAPAQKTCSMIIDGFSLSNSLDSNKNNITYFHNVEDCSRSKGTDDLQVSLPKIISHSDQPLPQEKGTKMTTIFTTRGKNFIYVKRKHSDTKNGALSKKKFRFMDGCQPTSIARKDFVSNDAWSRFIKLMRYKNSQLATVNKQCWRRGKRIIFYKDMLQRLQDKSKGLQKKQMQWINESQDSLKPEINKDGGIEITL